MMSYLLTILTALISDIRTLALRRGDESSRSLVLQRLEQLGADLETLFSRVEDPSAPLGTEFISEVNANKDRILLMPTSRVGTDEELLQNVIARTRKLLELVDAVDEVLQECFDLIPTEYIEALINGTGDLLSDHFEKEG